MSTFALWRLFHRHMFHHDDEPDAPRDHTGLLAVIAFAAATAIFLTVLGGNLPFQCKRRRHTAPFSTPKTRASSTDQPASGTFANTSL